MQEIARVIDKAVERGFVLVLLSPNSVQSQFTLREIQYALDKSTKAPHGANVVPIMLHDPRSTQGAMSPAHQLLLGVIQWFDFSQGNFDANMVNLIAHMKSRPME